MNTKNGLKRAKTAYYFFYQRSKKPGGSNLFIYQARGGTPGPSRVSDSPVSAENVVYEAFVLMGELR